MRLSLIILFFLASCTFNNVSFLKEEADWKSVDHSEAKEKLSRAINTFPNSITLRHRVLMKLPLEKRTLDQIALYKDGDFAISLYAPSYSRLLYRLIQHEDSLILIDYLERRYFQAAGIEEFPMEGIALFFQYYPDFIFSHPNGDLFELLGKESTKAYSNKIGDLLLSNGSSEFVLKKFPNDQFCLSRAVVSKGQLQTIFESDTLVEQGVCTSKKTVVRSTDNYNLEVESSLLLKSKDNKINDEAFIVNYPEGFSGVIKP